MANTEFDTTVDSASTQEIQFFDYAFPPLEAAEYTATAVQQITWTNYSVDTPYTTNQKFTVNGPRFTVPAQDVYSIYPPANGTADYHLYQPFIVMSEKTLPWSRTIDGKPRPVDPPYYPWMTLVLLTPDQIVNGKVQTGIVSNVTSPGGTIAGPQNLENLSADDEKLACQYIEVTADAFNSTFPRLEELPLMCHARLIDTANTETATMATSGYYSVVTGNRLALNNNGTVDYVACLVSVEGLQDYLPTSASSNNLPSGTTSVRLFALANWSFTSQTTGIASFKDLAQNISIGKLQMPNIPEGGTAASDLVKAAFSDGYTALNYLTRTGEQNAAWYRGPFTAVSMNDAQLDPFFSAEAGMVYDQTTGLFDMSYAVAWQIGRLLALSNKTFSSAIQGWRRQNFSTVSKVVNYSQTLNKLGNNLNLETDTVKAVSTPNYVQGKAAAYLGSNVNSMAAPESTDTTPMLKTADPTKVASVSDAVPGKLSDSEVQEGLASGKTVKQMLADKVSS